MLELEPFRVPYKAVHKVLGTRLEIPTVTTCMIDARYCASRRRTSKWIRPTFVFYTAPKIRAASVSYRKLNGQDKGGKQAKKGTLWSAG